MFSYQYYCLHVMLFLVSSKTWRDVWALEFEDLNVAKEKNSEWKSDTKYLKLQSVVDLCKNHEVLPLTNTMLVV